MKTKHLPALLGAVLAVGIVNQHPAHAEEPQNIVPASGNDAADLAQDLTNPLADLITRTIIPVIHHEDLFPGSGSQFGLGDTNMSLFFSPRSSSDDFVWGAGPVMLFPTTTGSLQAGVGYWAESPTNGADEFRFRLQMNFVLPKS